MKKYLLPGMKLNQEIVMFLLIIVMSLAFNDLFSQDVQTKPTRQSSFEAFSKGNYEQAYKEFGELLLTYSKDPLYKYYSGVCLVKLNREPDKAVTLLKQALQGAGVVKRLPSDADFYLGRAEQMSGNFTEAIESYNLFTKKVGKKEARQQDVARFIQQCNEKSGQIMESEINQPEVVKNENVTVPQPEVKPIADDVILKPVETPKIALPVSYDKILDEAIEFQVKADSLIALIVRQNADLSKLPDTDKAALRKNIKENEILAASFQKSADQKYGEAQAELVSQRAKAQPKVSLQQTDNKSMNDSLQKSDIGVVKESVKEADKTRAIVPAPDKPAEIFSLFEVPSNTVSDKDRKIIVDGEIPEGLIYRIQIGIFSKPVAPSYFKGIGPIYAFRVAGTENRSYYAGVFRRISDASKALTTVRSAGFRDAFIVALTGNTRVSADRAAIMEKEWGSKPLMTVSQVRSDTIPPTLSFRVEVARSMKPLKDDAVEGFKKMAGNRGLDVQPLENGSTAYLIGKFITFESAAEYADLMIRNGYREARVVAFLGKKEIPVETAKQLVDSPK